MDPLELRINSLEAALRGMSVFVNPGLAAAGTNCTDCGSNCTNCAGDEIRNVLLPGEENRLNGRDIALRLRQTRG